ncbi:MAG: PilZ domain-containing protein [Candidatus Omnitrophota bacterium]
MDKERRRAPRVNIMCKISAVFGERLLVFNSHTENVSSSGLRAVLEEKFHVPTEVEVELFFAEKGIPLKLKGQITWVRELGPAGTTPRLYDTGIKFLDVSEADKKEIETLLAGVKSNPA